MSDAARSQVERLYAALGAGDLDAAMALYAADAELVRYDGAAKGAEAIRTFYQRNLANHGQFELDEIVQFRAVDDVVIWDAMVSTDAGKLLTYDVAILDSDGQFARHVPGIRGYWGQ